MKTLIVLVILAIIAVLVVRAIKKSRAAKANRIQANADARAAVRNNPAANEWKPSPSGYGYSRPASPSIGKPVKRRDEDDTYVVADVDETPSGYMYETPSYDERTSYQPSTPSYDPPSYGSSYTDSGSSGGYSSGGGSSYSSDSSSSGGSSSSSSDSGGSSSSSSD